MTKTDILDIFGLCPQFLAHSSQTLWNFLNESNNGVSCYATEMTFGPHLRLMDSGPTKWLEDWTFQSHPLISGRGEGLEVESMT